MTGSEIYKLTRKRYNLLENLAEKTQGTNGMPAQEKAKIKIEINIQEAKDMLETLQKLLSVFEHAEFNQDCRNYY